MNKRKEGKVTKRCGGVGARTDDKNASLCSGALATTKGITTRIKSIKDMALIERKETQHSCNVINIENYDSRRKECSLGM